MKSTDGALFNKTSRCHGGSRKEQSIWGRTKLPFGSFDETMTLLIIRRCLIPPVLLKSYLDCIHLISIHTHLEKKTGEWPLTGLKVTDTVSFVFTRRCCNQCWRGDDSDRTPFELKTQKTKEKYRRLSFENRRGDFSQDDELFITVSVAD